MAPRAGRGQQAGLPLAAAQPQLAPSCVGSESEELFLRGDFQDHGQLHGRVCALIPAPPAPKW